MFPVHILLQKAHISRLHSTHDTLIGVVYGVVRRRRAVRCRPFSLENILASELHLNAVTVHDPDFLLICCTNTRFRIEHARDIQSKTFPGGQ